MRVAWLSLAAAASLVVGLARAQCDDCTGSTVWQLIEDEANPATRTQIVCRDDPVCGGVTIGSGIPSTITKLSALTVIDLTGQYDRFVINLRIASEIGKLPLLRQLLLSRAGLYFSIPSEMGNLSALEELDLSGNTFVGAVPTELGRLSALMRLSLGARGTDQENRFDGTIPTQLGELSALQDLDLSWNRLTGSIPSELGQLTALTRLVLNGNLLTGTIPDALGNASALSALFVSGNALTGTVPAFFANLTTTDVLVAPGSPIQTSAPTSAPLAAPTVSGTTDEASNVPTGAVAAVGLVLSAAVIVAIVTWRRRAAASASLADLNVAPAGGSGTAGQREAATTTGALVMRAWPSSKDGVVDSAFVPVAEVVPELDYERK